MPILVALENKYQVSCVANHLMVQNRVCISMYTFACIMVCSIIYIVFLREGNEAEYLIWEPAETKFVPEVILICLKDFKHKEYQE